MSSSSSSVSLKVYFTLPSGSTEIRRFSTQSAEALPALLSFLRATFEKRFSPPLSFVLQYDDGEDLCSISSEEELREALAVHAASGAGGALKLLAAFDGQHAAKGADEVQQEPVSATASTPRVSSLASPSGAAGAASVPEPTSASPSLDEFADAVAEEAASDNEEYVRIDDEQGEKAQADTKTAPTPASTAPVQVQDESAAEAAEAEAAAAAAASAFSSSAFAAAPTSSPAPTVEEPTEEPARQAPSIEDVSAAPASASAASDAAPAVHRGITCDGCGASPLVGARFHCETCTVSGGFDLCQACEENAQIGAKHKAQGHVFSVHTQPVQREAQSQCHVESEPEQSTAALVQGAVQRVLQSFSAAQRGDASAQPLEAIQQGVAQVMAHLHSKQQRQGASSCAHDAHSAADAEEEAALREREQQQQEASSSASASATGSAPASGPAVHSGVTCDGCGATPITGIRYRCRECRVAGGFDLCSACEEAGVVKGDHTLQHQMVKMRVPAEGHGHGHRGQGGFGRCGRGGRGGAHGPSWRSEGMQAPLGPMGLFSGVGPFNSMLNAALGGGMGGMGRGGMMGCGRGWGRGGGHGGRHAAQSDADRPKAQFISDVTLADGLQVRAGETLRKVWSVRNAGTLPWPQGTRLLFVGGDLAPESEGAYTASSGQARDQQGALVPFAAPGDVVHVSIDIVVPTQPGRFRATFRLATPEGDRFGPRVWIDLRVPEEAKQQQAASAASASAPAAPKEQVKAEAKTEPAAAASAVKSEPKQEAKPKVAAPVTVPVQAAKPVQVAAPAAASEEAALAAEFRAARISAPAAPASGAAAPRGFAYPEQLGHLRAMGFTDTALCKYLLLNNRGDLQATVQWLLANARA